MEFLKDKFKKKILLAGLIAFLVTSLSASTIRAAYNLIQGGGNPLEEYKQALEESRTNLPQWGLYNLNYIAQGLTRMMIGIPSLAGEQANSGATGVFAQLIDGMYQNRPISSTQYLAYLGQKLQIVQPVYAQGQGWQFLSPILPLWTVTRNIAYLFYVVIFVAIGFMIMFRTKLDPQTTVNVQNALPKIIVSLIFITFSYAICGLLIDLIYLFNMLLQSIFKNALVTFGLGGSYTNWFTTFHPITFITTISAAGGLTNLIINGFKLVLNLLGALGGDFTAIFSVIIGFALISSVIKIFFALLGKYVSIIMYAIFSPLVFLWGTLPGQSDHTPRFFRSFLSAILTFPAILLLLNITAAIVSASNPPAGVSPAGFTEIAPFSTSFVFDPAKPAPTANQIAAVLGSFIALGLVMATSKVTETIDDALKIQGGGGGGLGAESLGALRKIPIIGALAG